MITTTRTTHHERLVYLLLSSLTSLLRLFFGHSTLSLIPYHESSHEGPISALYTPFSLLPCIDTQIQ